MNITLNAVAAFSEMRNKFSSENLKKNDDSFISPLKKQDGFLFGVADGVGSYLGGKDASSFVCNYIESNQKISHDYIENYLARDLKESFQIFIENKSSDYAKASTTLSFCFLNTDGLSIWHIGDCRVYIKKENKLIQVTHDHTQYQQLLDQKIYNKKELREKNITKSVLTSAISPLLDVENDYIYINYETLKDYGQDISIYLMTDGAYHFWDLKKSFSTSTLTDITRFTNALKRRIERKGPIDDYTLLSLDFKLD